MGDAAIIDPREWPQQGRIGYCQAGTAQGRYFFLHLLTEDQDLVGAVWQGFLHPTIPHQLDDEIYAEHADGFMQNYVTEWNVEWSPAEVDVEAERRLFGLRDFWQTLSGESAPFESSAPRRTGDLPFGRAVDREAFGALLRDVREARGLSISDVSFDKLAFRRLPRELINDIETGSFEQLQPIIDLLAILDYDLAIAPRAGHLSQRGDDPWEEFRSPGWSKGFAH